jgi:hypothetical protein
LRLESGSNCTKQLADDSLAIQVWNLIEMRQGEEGWMIRLRIILRRERGKMIPLRTVWRMGEGGSNSQANRLVDRGFGGDSRAEGDLLSCLIVKERERGCGKMFNLFARSSIWLFVVG